MKKGEYNIAMWSCNDKKPYKDPRTGYIVKLISTDKRIDGIELGVCKEPGSGWRATHIKSGYCVGLGHTRYEAIEDAKTQVVKYIDKVLKLPELK